MHDVERRLVYFLIEVPSFLHIASLRDHDEHSFVEAVKEYCEYLHDWILGYLLVLETQLPNTPVSTYMRKEPSSSFGSHCALLSSSTEFEFSFMSLWQECPASSLFGSSFSKKAMFMTTDWSKSMKYVKKFIYSRLIEKLNESKAFEGPKVADASYNNTAVLPCHDRASRLSTQLNAIISENLWSLRALNSHYSKHLIYLHSSLSSDILTLPLELQQCILEKKISFETHCLCPPSSSFTHKGQQQQVFDASLGLWWLVKPPLNINRHKLLTPDPVLDVSEDLEYLRASCMAATNRIGSDAAPNKALLELSEEDEFNKLLHFKPSNTYCYPLPSVPELTSFLVLNFINPSQGPSCGVASRGLDFVQRTLHADIEEDFLLERRRLQLLLLVLLFSSSSQASVEASPQDLSLASSLVDALCCKLNIVDAMISSSEGTSMKQFSDILVALEDASSLGRIPKPLRVILQDHVILEDCSTSAADEPKLATVIMNAPANSPGRDFDSSLFFRKRKLNQRLFMPLSPIRPESPSRITFKRSKSCQQLFSLQHGRTTASQELEHAFFKAEEENVFLTPGSHDCHATWSLRRKSSEIKCHNLTFSSSFEQEPSSLSSSIRRPRNFGIDHRWALDKPVLEFAKRNKGNSDDASSKGSDKRLDAPAAINVPETPIKASRVNFVGIKVAVTPTTSDDDEEIVIVETPPKLTSKKQLFFD